MKSLVVLLLFPISVTFGAELTLSSPTDYQVVQRSSREQGSIRIAGELTQTPPENAVVEARLISPPAEWRIVKSKFTGKSLEAELPGPAGGWFRLEVRVRDGDRDIAQTAVEHVGVGEVFVIAGQSNSANHGEERQQPKSGRVVNFDGKRWRPANDPQPGASGDRGSFIPPFGDALVERLKVPVGVVCCGIGATSVREWLPKGATFPHPPTIESRVEKLASGEWASKGEAFAMFVARMKPLGPHGFRVVLWHQGESDANQRDTTRTLAGKFYREYLEQVIRESRRELGWDPPWFVAQVSYHTPGDEAWPDLRDAQASLWIDGIAFEGPDSDALKGDLRENQGRGVHFSGPGLREHGARWADKVAAWIEKR